MSKRRKALSVDIDGILSNADWTKKTDDTWEGLAKARRTTEELCTHGMLVAACYDKSCAPPPVGKGGSNPSRGGLAGRVRQIIGEESSLSVLAYTDKDRQWRVQRMSAPRWSPDSSITSETEAAVRRVGREILREMSDRFAAEWKQDEVIRRHTEHQQRIADAMGYPADRVEVDIDLRIRVRGVKSIPSDRLDAGKAELAKVLKEDPLFESDRALHLSNARISLRERICQETISEVTGASRQDTIRTVSMDERLRGALTKALNYYPDAWKQASGEHSIGLDISVDVTGRAGYKPETGVLRGSISPSEMRHELGHRFQQTVPGINELEALFLARRTQGEKPVRLMDLDPDNYKDPGEIALPDEFPNPYTGKVYQPRQNGLQLHEVFTVGMQYLPQSFGRTDAPIDVDHMEFVLGVVATVWRQA